MSTDANKLECIQKKSKPSVSIVSLSEFITVILIL
jgi:hypothetical protein